MKHIFFALALSCISTLSFSKSCWNEFLLSELADRQGKNIYEVISSKSDYIFAGEALSTKKTTFREKSSEEFLFENSTEFSISESYKGRLSSRIIVHSGGVENCGCAYDFEPGWNIL